MTNRASNEYVNEGMAHVLNDRNKNSVVQTDMT